VAEQKKPPQAAAVCVNEVAASAVVNANAAEQRRIQIDERAMGTLP
jgi:hypothetical protein